MRSHLINNKIDETIPSDQAQRRQQQLAYEIGRMEGDLLKVNPARRARILGRLGYLRPEESQLRGLLARRGVPLLLSREEETLKRKRERAEIEIAAQAFWQE